ncbi:MAG: TetR/AcrR family transcriptional regulator [Solirubrobacterales bacterium]|nr:TetR/AcrR family transcriptional regulator [Solirubrobacterales bacterium]
MAFSPPPTAKGARQSEAIIDAAVRCLATDGYSASSIGRIAEQAGVHKRMVLYYFASREELFDVVVQRIGDQLLGQLEAALLGLEEPADIVSVGFDQIWERMTSDRALLAAYFGLVAESVTNRHLRKSVGYINDGYRRLIHRLSAELASRGRRLTIDEQALTVLIIAGIQGLTLEYLERGDTPALRSAIDVFQGWLGSVAPAR